MANMFSEKSEQRIPQTLNECTLPNATAASLNSWSVRLENWGQVFFVILIILGIILSLGAAFSEADQAFVYFLSTAITWGIYAFIEYCTYHVLALLISALASITQSNVVCANLALLNASRDPDIPVSKLNFTEEACEKAPKKRTVDYTCKGFRVNGKQSHGTCGECFKKDVPLTECDIKTEIGTKHRYICMECIEGFQENCTNS